MLKVNRPIKMTIQINTDNNIFVNEKLSTYLSSLLERN
jgi:hypothetical protein